MGFMDKQTLAKPWHRHCQKESHGVRRAQDGTWLKEDQEPLINETKRKEILKKQR